METENTNSREAHIAKLVRGIEAAKKLQQARITYGIEYVYLYVDVEGEWWETNENSSEEEERKEEIIYFLKSDEEVAVRVRKRLKAMWIAEIAAELEKSLRLSASERNYAVKNLLGSGVQKTGSESKTEEIELQDLAADLLEKLDEILTELAPSEDEVAQKVRERLEQALSISEIVAQLEKNLSMSDREERTWLTKDLFLGTVAEGAIVREESVAEDEEIEILDLAEDLLEKLDEIFGIAGDDDDC